MINFGSEGRGWYIGPLLCLLPVFAQIVPRVLMGVVDAINVRGFGGILRARLAHQALDPPYHLLHPALLAASAVALSFSGLLLYAHLILC